MQLLQGSHTQGWGCAVGGGEWKRKRLGVLAQWFCARQRLLAVEFGYTAVKIAPTPAAANSSLGGYPGQFYRSLTPELAMRFECAN